MNKKSLIIFAAVCLGLSFLIPTSWAVVKVKEATIDEMNKRLEKIEETQETILEQQTAILESVKQLKVWVRRN